MSELYTGYPRPRCVAEVIAIDPAVIAQLDVFRAARPEVDEFTRNLLDHTVYTSQHLRPFGELINLCIPAGAGLPNDLPVGRAQFLAPYVAVYIERAVRPGCLLRSIRSVLICEVTGMPGASSQYRFGMFNSARPDSVPCFIRDLVPVARQQVRLSRWSPE